MLVGKLRLCLGILSGRITSLTEGQYKLMGYKARTVTRDGWREPDVVILVEGGNPQWSEIQLKAENYLLDVLTNCTES